jgi:hypothetical protein
MDPDFTVPAMRTVIDESFADNRHGWVSGPQDATNLQVPMSSDAPEIGSLLLGDNKLVFDWKQSNTYVIWPDVSDEGPLQPVETQSVEATVLITAGGMAAVDCREQANLSGSYSFSLNHRGALFLQKTWRDRNTLLATAPSTLLDTLNNPPADLDTSKLDFLPAVDTSIPHTLTLWCVGPQIDPSDDHTFPVVLFAFLDGEEVFRVADTSGDPIPAGIGAIFTQASSFEDEQPFQVTVSHFVWKVAD